MDCHQQEEGLHRYRERERYGKDDSKEEKGGNEARKLKPAPSPCLNNLQNNLDFRL